MPRQVVSALAALALAAMTLPACSSGGSNSNAAPAISIRGPDPHTFDGAFEARLKSDGTVPFQLALDVFTTVIGPLPGVHAARLPTKGIRSATVAVNALLAHFDELTPAQQGAARKLLVGPGGRFVRDATAVPPGAGTGSAGPVGGTAVPPRRLGVATTVEQYVPLIGDARTRIEGLLHHPLRLTIRARVAPTSAPTYDAETLPIDADGNPASTAITGCLITFGASAATFGADGQRSIVAHEVFHCFQHDLLATSTNGLPQWIIEGQAAWVGETVAGGTSYPSEWWRSWLAGSNFYLFQRSYDAIGFYAVLAANGHDPWSVMPAMLAASRSGSVSAYRVAVGGEGNPFISRVAEAITRSPTFGTDWESTGPGITTDRGTLERTVALGAPVTLDGDLADRGTKGLELTVDGDILTIRSNVVLGAISFHDGRTTRFTTGVQGGWCMRADGCACPDGTVPSVNGGPLAPGGSGPKAALALASIGNLRGFTLQLAAHSLADECTTPPSDTTNAACLIGSFRLVDQRLARPIVSSLGSIRLTGGIGGRHIELRADGTYHVTDDGSDPVNVSIDTSAGPAESTANITADGNGHYTAGGGSTVEFALDAITGQTSISVVSGGQTINSVQPLDATLGAFYGLSGTAHYTCSGNQVTLAFPNVTFVLKRE